MNNIQFAQIPFDLICRFGELSKTEIRIVCYLYACRNRHTGRCSPSRKQICSDARIEKTHLSSAIKNLEKNGWIIEDGTGYFTLSNDPQKVTESVTFQSEKTPEKVTDSVTKIEDEKVTDSVTKVTDSVTKVTDSVTLLNKVFKHKNNIKRTQKKNIGNNVPQKIKKGVRISKNFYPSEEMILYAKKELPNIDLEAKILEFRNHWISQTGDDAFQADWNQVFKNRVIQIVEWLKNQTTNKRGNNNGIIQKNNGNGSNGNEKPSNIRQIAETDYSDFANIEYPW